MKQRLLWSFGLLILLAAGCRKDPVNNLTNEDSRIYITNHDSSINFASYQTFSIADSVLEVDGGHVAATSNQTDQAFLAAVKATLQQRGYRLVNKTDKPDLAVTVSRIINTSTGVISYGNYWDYYSGYYDPYYWGYGGYGWGAPSWGYATYQVREGLLSVDISDLKNASAGNQLKVVWNGLIRGSGIFDASTAASQVNQLFSQSAYLTNE
jgi:hypothetical protein